MKKSIALGILGLAAGVAMSYGQGQITLDTYASSSSVVVNHSGSPVLAGLGLYAGFYYGPLNVNDVSSVAPDASGIADPMTLLPAFTLASGPGAVANQWVGASGQFTDQLNGGPTTSFQIAPSGAPGSYTIMLVVYNNFGGYNLSSIRGHSDPFQMTAGVPITSGSGDIGRDGMDVYFGGPSTINALPVPEPTTLALGGLGGLALLLMRRKKA